MRSAVELFRRDGFASTSVDEICSAAGVTKGAFFHYFQSKEALAEQCLGVWRDSAVRMVEKAWAGATGPVERLHRFMDAFLTMLENPGDNASCLAGTLVQETSESNPKLREAAGRCLGGARDLCTKLIAECAAESGRTVDAASLAALWLSALQGGLLLYKAFRDPRVPLDSLRHVKSYIDSQLGLTEGEGGV